MAANWIWITRWIAVIGLAIGALGIISRLQAILSRPFKQDLARPRGSIRRGVLYAFTLGMAPWEKESTRLHWLAYFRGIFFHLGVFAAFAVLFASPWLAAAPGWLLWVGRIFTGAGAVFGVAGIPMRWTGENERNLSTPDDYFAVLLTSLFTALAFGVLVEAALLPIFYLATALLAIYIPFGKIRHCVYFFFSKFFFGLTFGRRGVIGQPDAS